MGIPHGTSFTTWLNRYRAAEGGAVTPNLAGELPGVILIADVRDLSTPKVVPHWTRSFQVAPVVAEYSFFSVLGGPHGSWAHWVQVNMDLATEQWYLTYVEPKAAPATRTFIHNNRAFSGPALVEFSHGADPAVITWGAGAARYNDGYAVEFPLPGLFIPPGAELVVLGVTAGEGFQANVYGSDVPMS